MKDNQIPDGPTVCSEEYQVRCPNVCCTVYVIGEIGADGVGFSRCHDDPFDLTFGKKLARRRAVADAEREYYRALADFQYEQRMREIKQMVNVRYPKPTPSLVKPTHEGVCDKAYTCSTTDFFKKWIPIHNFTDDDSAEIVRDDDES